MNKIDKGEAYKIVKENVSPEIWKKQQQIIELWEYASVKERNNDWRDNTLYNISTYDVKNVINFYEDKYETKASIKWYINLLKNNYKDWGEIK